MHLLLWLEQSALYNAINNDLTIVGVENRTVHTTQVNVFACPSDPEAGRLQLLNASALARYGVADPAFMAVTSYAGCTGSFETTSLPLPSSGCVVNGAAAAQNNGCFHDVAPITFAAITDGLAGTILMMERSVTSLRDLDVVNPKLFLAHGWMITGNWGDTLVTAFYPPNAYKKVAVGSSTALLNAGSSEHPGGLNVLLGDGSVRVIKESIDTWPFDALTGNPTGATQSAAGVWQNAPAEGIWQVLATRNGGEATSAESF